MDHIDGLLCNDARHSTDLVAKLTGRYFTPSVVAREMLSEVVGHLLNAGMPKLVRVVDPFAGDGRLLEQLVHIYTEAGGQPIRWCLEAWDMDTRDLEGLGDRMQRNFPQHDIQLTVLEVDSFRHSALMTSSFDVVVTNPPWELLKPDPRELSGLAEPARQEYVQAMRQYAALLDSLFPDAKPDQKFAGWGTNLSRVGLDVSLQLLNSSGVLGIVMPASLLADTQSKNLRKKLLTTSNIKSIALYPAEARLFGRVDIPCITLTATVAEVEPQVPLVTRYDANLRVMESGEVSLTSEFLCENDYIIPVSQGNRVPSLMTSLSLTHRPLAEYSVNIPHFWMGREVDETRISERASESPSALTFFRGRLVARFQAPLAETFKISPINPPTSSGYERIAWRDISRPSQRRRMIATIIPPNSIAGNSLGIACFKNDSSMETRLLLGVLCSYVFEFQLRAHLATNHVSLSAMKKVRVPSLSALKDLPDLLDEVERLLETHSEGSVLLECIVAKQAYGLDEAEFLEILSHFVHLKTEEIDEYKMTFRNLNVSFSNQKEARLVA